MSGLLRRDLLSRSFSNNPRLVAEMESLDDFLTTVEAKAAELRALLASAQTQIDSLDGDWQPASSILSKIAALAGQAGTIEFLSAEQIAVRPVDTADDASLLTKARADTLYAATGGIGGGGAGITDGDKGDIIVSGGGTVWELDVAAAKAALDLGHGMLALDMAGLLSADPAVPLVRWELGDAINFTGSGAGLVSTPIAATGTPSLPIKKNGAGNGSIAVSGTGGVITFTNSAYVAGDLFEIYPPATADATLDRLSVTFETD